MAVTENQPISASNLKAVVDKINGAGGGALRG